MTAPDGVSHRRAARNTLWNIVGYLAPLIVVLVALPPTIAKLGIERYGILALVLVVHDYLGYLDFGLGRAATREIATAVHDPVRRDDARTIFFTSAFLHVTLGVGLAFVALGVVSPLAGLMLPAGSGLFREARDALLASVLFSPTLLLLTSARGALEAVQRFDIVNLVRIPSNMLTYLVPLAGAVAGYSLPRIVLLMVAVRFGTAMVYVLLSLRTLPPGRRIRLDLQMGRPMLSLGGWIMAANLAGMILVSGNRPIIGALASVAALTYYAVSQDVVSRLWILPSSVSSALFPMFVAAADSEMDRVGRLFADGALYMLLLFVPPIVVVMLFGHDLLALWMDSGFADRSAQVFTILILGVAADGIARVPLTLLQARDRAHVVARVRLWLVPAFLAATVWAIDRWSIVGAATVWTVRIVIEAVALFYVTARIGAVRIPAPAARRVRWGGLATAAVLLLCSLPYLGEGATLTQRLVLLTGSLIAFAVFSWIVVIDRGHRSRIRRVFAGAR